MDTTQPTLISPASNPHTNQQRHTLNAPLAPQHCDCGANIGMSVAHWERCASRVAKSNDHRP